MYEGNNVIYDYNKSFNDVKLNPLDLVILDEDTDANGVGYLSYPEPDDIETVST